MSISKPTKPQNTAPQTMRTVSWSLTWGLSYGAEAAMRVDRNDTRGEVCSGLEQATTKEEAGLSTAHHDEANDASVEMTELGGLEQNK
jgi:hypothetical protein